MKLGVIIVTYNSQYDIVRLFESLLIQSYKDFIVYIVDNNSNDDTLNIVQKYQTKATIRIISCNTNNGFAKGNNIGIQKAMDEGCDLLFILNPDMQLDENCIDILTKRITSDEKIGVIGPIVLFGNDPSDKIQVYGVNANFKTQKKAPSITIKYWTNKLPAEVFVDFVLGGAMMIRSSVLKVTGLFEEDYFMYNDEIDLAYRIKKAGFRTLCMRDAKVRHFHDFNSRNQNGNNLMYYYVLRNRFLYFKKFRLYKNLYLNLIKEILTIPLKIVWAIRRMGNIKLLKFYYSGVKDGLTGKKGLANISFDVKSKVKKIILTADYELFLGRNAGTVQKSMIEPTKRLKLILEKNNSKITLFWDILHYYRLFELENMFLELKQDRILIEEQILDLVKAGHDIQMHIHPHWLDANWENGKWKFTYERFKLHNLSSEYREEDINTITGCISITKKLMEDLIRKVKPDYKVTAYRAGGYLIEPFDKIREALLKNGIVVDSSICTGLINDHGIFSFDFRSYPDKLNYNFEYTPKNIVNAGSFIEIPITTIKLSRLTNIFFALWRRFKYPNLEQEREGKGVGEYFKPKLTSKFNIFVHEKTKQLTTDNNYKEFFYFVLNKTTEYSTMILHPKLLNSHTLEIFDDLISADKIRFISIQEFLTQRYSENES